MLYRFLMLCLAMGLLTGCQIDPGKGLDAAHDAYKAATLTEEDAVIMGKQAAEQYDKKSTIASKNSAYSKRLARLTKNLHNVDGLNLNYKVYMTKDINAFALPDGSIRVFSGLMDLMSDDELFHIIGHEIGHVKNKDSLDRFRVAYAASAARKGAAASGSAVASAISKSELGDIAEAFVNAQYSQKQEYAADKYGMELVKAHKRDTSAPGSGMRKLAALGSSSGPLSTHPDSDKRAERLDAMR